MEKVQEKTKKFQITKMKFQYFSLLTRLYFRYPLKMNEKLISLFLNINLVVIYLWKIIGFEMTWNWIFDWMSNQLPTLVPVKESHVTFMTLLSYDCIWKYEKMWFGNDIKHVKAQTVISNTIDHHHRSRKMLDFDFYLYLWETCYLTIFADLQIILSPSPFLVAKNVCVLRMSQILMLLAA